VTTKDLNRMKACRHGDMLYNVNESIYRTLARSLWRVGRAELSCSAFSSKPGDSVSTSAPNSVRTPCSSRTRRGAGTVFAFEPQRVVLPAPVRQPGAQWAHQRACLTCGRGAPESHDVVPNVAL